MEIIVNNLINEALHYLDYAEGELCRPEEDVVTYCACHFTRKSINDFLRAYLLNRKKSTSDAETLDDLFTRCSKLEPKFRDIDLSCFGCINVHNNVCDEKFCLSVDHVNTCYARANEIKDMVLGFIKLPETA